ncbi:YggL 50S ribosome-binding family protein [Diaphorobacter caeni]|uniref:YggL 50S ribosome-binding family protein n=1 Tax=Diaphorobacter caeni TaxID=2784387 RepID=UPI00188FFBD0|nr:YggL family protein [Diaphorobacter caeni]MBF5007401.1 YggL family protein [Diaphorobacter caeni]
MSLPPNKQRSRRQRKKMHIAEFQELGFEYEVELKDKLSPDAQEALMDQFLTEVVVPRSLMLGGWLSEGFVTAYPRGSATEEDRQVVEKWLKAQFKDAPVRVSELKDAWYVQD